jgi:DNA-binding transcriptional LysR family regulator
MEFRHLRTFLVVTDTLNISEAARRLRATQPALSRQIRTLEHTVGNALFVRHRKGLRLTLTGAALREQGTKILEAVEAALRSAREAERRQAAVVRLGFYGSSVWDKVIAPAVELFSRRFPDVTLNIIEDASIHLAERLSDGRLDVALLGSGRYDALPGVLTEVACAVPAMVVVAANHRLAKKRGVSLADLREEQIIGVKEEDAPGRYRTFIAACRDAGFVPKIDYVASNFPELTMAVRKQAGVAIVSSFATTVPHPGVVFLRMKPPCVPLEIYVAQATSSSPTVRHLAPLIITQARAAAERAGGADCASPRTEASAAG